MIPAELVEGQEYVVSVDVEKDGADHPQLDPGDVVTLVNGTPDSDGEVYVTAVAVKDGATIGAWVKTEYLITREQAEEWIRSEYGDEALDPDDDEGMTFSYIPHPDYPHLPTFETLPLGYALGIVQFIKDLGRVTDPQQALLMQYLQSRGFPTA